MTSELSCASQLVGIRNGGPAGRVSQVRRAASQASNSNFCRAMKCVARCHERDVAVGPRTPGVPGLGHRPKLTGPCVNDRRGVTLSHAPPTTPTERTPHDLLTVAGVESVYESEGRAIPRTADRVVAN